MIEKLFKSIVPITVNLTPLLTAHNKVAADVDDIIFLLKKRIEDEDNSAVFTKTLDTSGITFNTGTAVATILFTVNDYGVNKLLANETYHICLGVKFTGDSFFVESDTLTPNTVKILPDRVRA